MRYFTLWILLGCVALSSQAPGKRAVTIDCTIVEKPGVCDSSVCSNPAIGAVSCPHTCGYCEPRQGVDCSQNDKEGICEGDFCSPIVNDVNVTQRLCPHFCNYCTGYVQPTFSPCVDNLAHGVQCSSLQDICEDPLASSLCAKTCGLCEHEPTPPPDTNCIDHITNNLTCSQIPSFCVDPYAVRLCRQSCGKCHEPHPTEPVPTTTTTTSPPSTTTTPAPPVTFDCQDFVGNGFHCSFVVGICEDKIGRIVCPKFCGTCRAPEGTTEEPINYNPSDCRDHMTGSVTCNLLGICDSKAKFFCPAYCKTCDSQPPTCVDHLTKGNNRCDNSPYICESVYGRLVCPRTCGQCAGPPPSEEPMTTESSITCQDHVGEGLTCQQLIGGVCDDVSGIGGDILCPKFCGRCQVAECTDHLINGKRCEDTSYLCDNKYFNVVCPRTCGQCTGPTPVEEEQTTVSSDPCQDNVGKGLDCSQLSGVCHDDSGIGSDNICQRYCGTCQSSNTTNAYSSVSPQPSDGSLVTGGTSPVDNGDTCVDRLLYGASCADITDACVSPLGNILCRRYCRFCVGPTDSIPTPQAPPTKYCTDLIGYGLECHQLAGSVCGDVNFKHLCPKFCGACDCDDNVGKGESCDDPKYDDICEKPYGHLVCPSRCGKCQYQAPNPTDVTPSSTFSSPSPSFLPCEDHVGNGLSCPQLRDTVNFCQDPNSKLICRKTCSHCSDTTTAQTTTTTTSATTTTTTATTTTTMTTASTVPVTSPPTTAATFTSSVTDESTTNPAPLECVDHLINGVLCSSIPDVCTNMYGLLTCKRHCGSCTGPTPPPQATSIPSGCEDNVGVGLTCQELPGVCSDHQGIGPDTFCPKFCGVCDQTTQAQTTQAQSTQPQTTQVPGNTGSPDSSTSLTTLTSPTTSMTSTVSMTSPLIDVSTTTAVCEDLLKENACEQMEIDLPTMCSDPNSKLACAKYCGFCSGDSSTTQTSTPLTTPTTTPTAAPYCKPRDNPSCFDVGDKELCNLHLFCSNEVAKTICRKTCQFCDSGCEDRLSPSSTYTCPQLNQTNSGLCQDDLGSRLCQKTCGCDGYCPLRVDG